MIRHNPNKGKFGGNHPRAKVTLQFTKEGDFIMEWASIIDAQKNLGINISTISACCNGKYKTSGGFIWKYKNHETHNN